jgi:hypothetical protein
MKKFAMISSPWIYLFKFFFLCTLAQAYDIITTFKCKFIEIN